MIKEENRVWAYSEICFSDKLNGKNNSRETYNTYLSEIENAKDYKDVPLCTIESSPDVDTFMAGQTEVTLPYDRIIDGVLIEGRDDLIRSQNWKAISGRQKPEARSWITASTSRMQTQYLYSSGTAD